MINKILHLLSSQTNPYPEAPQFIDCRLGFCTIIPPQFPVSSFMYPDTELISEFDYLKEQTIVDENQPYILCGINV